MDKNKHWLNWPTFYALTEIYQVPLNIIWFVFSFGIAYKLFHITNLLNVALCCIDVMLFDLAVNVADNYFDYIHANDPHFKQVTNPVGRLHLPLNQVKKLVVIMYIISAIPGLVLVYLTGWQVFVLGTIGYLIGIFYTAGKYPLNATPICEAIVSFFIAFFIILVGVYVTIFDKIALTWEIVGRVFLLCLPLMLVFYAIQLANNACDLKEDLINGRHTLASFIGQNNSIKLIKILVIIGFLMPAVLAIFKLVPWVVGLTSLLLILFWRQLEKFFQKPEKDTTYFLLFKETAQFLIAYIVLYTIMAFV